jgi:hypothetical protein
LEDSTGLKGPTGQFAIDFKPKMVLPLIAAVEQVLARQP